MTRRQWMWLWIWLLIFFIIFCIWNKLQGFKNDHKIDTATHTYTETSAPANIAATAAAATAVNSASDVVKQKDINLKIVKNDNEVKISGVFGSKEEVEALKSAFGKISDNVVEGTIIIDKAASNSKITALMPTMTEEFSHFKNGYIEYNSKTLTIDGIVNDPSIKQSISDKALLSGDLMVNNNITVETDEADATESSTADVSTASLSTDQQKEVETEENNISIQQKLNDLFKLQKIEFLYAKDVMTEPSERIIDQVYAILNKYKNTRVEVGGHTDSDGSVANNKRLSQKRADAIKAYLVKKGISSDRLNAVGYGESKPLVKNSSLANKQINRRVEFKIIGE